MSEIVLGNKPTLAIISTWQELCGIAHYTYFLKRALDPYFNIEIIPTPRSLLMADADQDEVRSGDLYIREIGRKLADFDFVNIQFEPGILGRGMPTVSRRFVEMLRNSRRLVVTFHSVARGERQRFLDHARLWARLYPHRSVAAILREQHRRRYWNKIYSFLNKQSESRHVSVIAHSKKDASYLKLKIPNIEIFDTPLTYLDSDYIGRIDSMFENTKLANVVPKPLNSNIRYIGCFGFYHHGKGYDTAIEAIRLLPDNYELLLFCSIPETMLKPNQCNFKYLDSLIAKIVKNKEAVSARPLHQRVHFIGAVEDDDIILGMMLCDAVLFPYANTLQTASGPISIALELDRPVLASRNTHFIEFQKYVGRAFEMCDIGNALEYSQKIQLLSNNRYDCEINGLRVVKYPSSIKKYTPNTTAMLYLNSMKRNE